MATGSPSTPFIKRFDEIGPGDGALVGGKNASLGEMHRALASRGVPVPDGFVIMTHIARFPLEQGIDRISLNPDAALRTTLAVREMEKKLLHPASS